MKRSLVGAALSAFWWVWTAGPAVAGEKPLVGPVPAWVRPAPDPSLKDLPQSGNVFPLFDEQALVDGDTVTTYLDTAILVTSPEVLNRAGTLAYPWQPNHGDITFHRIEIVRGNQRIDALKDGGGITVLHRELGLEEKMVDGQLTAVQHVEGLQVGDMLRVTLSISQRDEVLRGHVQDGILLLPQPVQVGFGRARLVWPQGRPLTWKAFAPGVTATPQPIEGHRQELVVPLPISKLPEMPANYPVRFAPVPMIVLSSFKSWSEVKAVMAPLYRVDAASIANGSDLARRVDAIAARTKDPLQRMADALQMVQDDVRYQLVAMGTGNYVPQTPTETWTKRYGDCKAKTMLLLAVLGRLGIKAEPVLAHSQRGDAVRDTPPSPLAFDHVFVRAELDGESYWLDGTDLGSRLEDIHDTPWLGTVLPLFSREGDLIDLPRRAHARPDLDLSLTYDMSAGPHIAAPFHLELRYEGPSGAHNRIEGDGAAEERLKSFAETAARQWAGSTLIGKPQAAFDATSATWTMRVDGVSTPNWSFEDARYQLELHPTLKVSFNAPRGRAAWRTLPALIPNPWTAHSHIVIRLPDAGRGVALTGSQDGVLTVPAVDWRRKVALSGAEVVEDITTRESGVEIPADQISPTLKAIRDAMAKTVHVALPVGYPERWDDAPRMRAAPATAKILAIFNERIADKPEDAQRLTQRGAFKVRLLDFAGAEDDFSKALEVDRSARLYVNRAQLRARRGDHAHALEDAQAAYALEQGDRDVRTRLAIELSYAGKVDQALELSDADADVATEDGLDAFLQRLEVYEIGGRFDDGFEMVDEALKTHPRMAKLLNARCWLRGLHAVDLDGALIDCNRAIELSADPAAYLDSRGMVHFRAGKFEAALADYDAALEAEPEYSDSLFMSGVVLARLGRTKEAEDRLRAARALTPNLDQYFARFGIKP